MRSLFSKFFFLLFLPVVLFVLPFVVPAYHLKFDVSTPITIISLLFAILIGFFIAAATTNYLSLRSLLANEASGLAAVYNLAILIQPSVKKKLGDAIDRYVIAAFNYELTEYVNYTQPLYSELIRIVDDIKPHDVVGTQLVGSLHDKKLSVSDVRQEVPLSAQPIVGRNHWFVIILLMLLIVALMLALRDGSIIYAVISGVLSVAMYFILILLYEVDGNYFMEEQMSFQTGQILFSMVGRLNYYPDYALRQGRIKHLPKMYRTGTFKDPANPQAKEIRVIKKTS